MFRQVATHRASAEHGLYYKLLRSCGLVWFVFVVLFIRFDSGDVRMPTLPPVKVAPRERRRPEAILEVEDDYGSYLRAVLRQAAKHPERHPQNVIRKQKR